MKIGIIGAGSIAQTYGKLWSAAGHQVMVSSRRFGEGGQRPRDLDGALDIGDPSAAASFGDIVVLAVSYWTIDEALETLRPHVRGKLVVDATNPLRYAEVGGTERVIGDDEIAGLVTAQKLPEARVAKAFTTLWTGYVEEHADRATPTVAMTFAVDDAEDSRLIASVIEDAGLVPVDLGSLAESRPLDPPSPIWNVVLSPKELRARVESFRASNVEAASSNIAKD